MVLQFVGEYVAAFLLKTLFIYLDRVFCFKTISQRFAKKSQRVTKKNTDSTNFHGHLSESNWQVNTFNCYFQIVETS